MRFHKEYPRVDIGDNEHDVTLKLIHPDGESLLSFQQPAQYGAYIVDGDCNIPEWYLPVLSCNDRLEIEDESGNRKAFTGKGIRVYRAWYLSTIIQILDTPVE